MAEPLLYSQAALGPASAWGRARGVVTTLAASVTHLAAMRSPPAAVTPGNAIITSADLAAGVCLKRGEEEQRTLIRPPRAH